MSLTLKQRFESHQRLIRDLKKMGNDFGVMATERERDEWMRSELYAIHRFIAEKNIKEFKVIGILLSQKIGSRFTIVEAIKESHKIIADHESERQDFNTMKKKMADLEDMREALELER